MLEVHDYLNDIVIVDNEVVLHIPLAPIKYFLSLFTGVESNFNSFRSYIADSDLPDIMEVKRHIAKIDNLIKVINTEGLFSDPMSSRHKRSFSLAPSVGNALSTLFGVATEYDVDKVLRQQSKIKSVVSSHAKVINQELISIQRNMESVAKLHSKLYDFIQNVTISTQVSKTLSYLDDLYVILLEFNHL